MTNIIRDPHGVTLEAFSYTTPPTDRTESRTEFFTKTAFLVFCIAVCRLGVEEITPHPLQLALLVIGGAAAVYASITLLGSLAHHIRSTGAVAIVTYISGLVLLLMALGRII